MNMLTKYRRRHDWMDRDSEIISVESFWMILLYWRRFFWCQSLHKRLQITNSKLTYTQSCSLWLKCDIILKMGQPQPLFMYFWCFEQQQFYGKIVDFSEIQTRIVGVEGELADQLTTTTALRNVIISMSQFYLYTYFDRSSKFSRCHNSSLILIYVYRSDAGNITVLQIVVKYFYWIIIKTNFTGEFNNNNNNNSGYMIQVNTKKKLRMIRGNLCIPSFPYLRITFENLKVFQFVSLCHKRLLLKVQNLFVD